MACLDKIAKDILNSCDIVPRAGFEPVAWAINREDIDTITYDGIIPNLISALALDAGTYGYNITAVKKEMSGGFDLITGDDIPDTYLNYFAFKPYEQDAASIKNFDDMKDLVIIAELKGEKTEGCFVIYGLEKGLYKTSGTQRGQDNNGLPIYEMQSLSEQGERYSRFIFWDTDYATTKAAMESLTQTYGPELVVNGGFDTDTVWLKGSAATITGGVGVITAGPNEAAFTQASILIVGKTYRLEYTILGYVDGEGRIRCGTTFGTIRTANGTYVEELVCASNAYLYLYSTDVTNTFNVDNVSVKEVL